MKIFKLDAVQEGYGWLTTKEKFTYDEIHSYDGRTHTEEEWRDKKVVMIKEGRKKYIMGDYTECHYIPTFSKNAVEKLYELIKDDVEILPLDCKAGEYSLINVTTVLEAFNREKAEFETFDNSIRIMYVEKYAFYEDVIGEHDIFKTIEEKLGPVFVSERFVQAVEENKLTAFRFKLVWDSEEDKK